MKNLTIIILLFSLFILPFSLLAQSAKSSEDWVGMMRDNKVNVHDVQKAFYKWYKKHHKEDKNKVGTRHVLSPQKEKEDDESYQLFKRWEWYNLPRTDKNGNRADPYKVASDYDNYLQSVRTIHESSLHHAHSIASTGTWTYVGNTTVPTGSSTGNGGDGRVNRVRVFPGNKNIMYACAASGGLWKTTNGGTSWSTNTDQLGSISTSDIAINPLKTNIMYLATGDGDGIQSIYPTPATIGVLKSFDGGNTWNATGLSYTLSNAGANNYTVNELLIDPADTAIILAATSFGIFRSTNSGGTWTQTSSATWFHSMEFEPGHPSIVYAATSDVTTSAGANFYRSVNNGISWTQITSGLPSNTVAEGFDIGVTAADSTVVYVLADNQNTYDFNGLYLSTNHGVSFTAQSTTPNILGRANDGSDWGTGQGWYDLTMAVSQTNKDSVWVGGINIWASSNAGVTWAENSDWTGSGAPYVHADIHDIQFIPGNSKGYIAGCDGGVFITTNSGPNWTDISNNLEIGQQYSIGPSASTAGMWLTGWQDNGTNFSSSPWSQVYGGDGMVCFIDWSNNNNYYAEQPEGGLSQSSDGGNTWNDLTGSITENGPWVTEWLQDPKTSTTLYSGFSNVWKSTNSGNTWNTITNWGGSGSITALAVDSANPNYIYAAQSNIIEVTTNGGTSWTNITGTLPVGSTSISAIAVNAKHPSHIWVTFAGYSSGNEVFASINSGSSWTNISTGLPNLPVNCIVSESGSPNGIYVGTDQGVYYNDTTLNSWVFYNTGLPMVMIGDLKIYKPGKQLLAATYGRGTWESPLYAASFSCTLSASASATANVSCNGGNNGSASATPSGGTSPYTYSWSGGGTNSTKTGLTAGTYTVTLTDKNGCTAKASVSITQPKAMRDSVVSQTNELCNGASTAGVSIGVSIGASPFTFLWSPTGKTNQIPSGLSAGTYTVTVTNHNGCSNTLAVTVTQPPSVRDSVASLTYLTCSPGTGNATIGIKGGTLPYTFTWTPNVSTTAAATGLTTGSYTVNVKDKNGCSSALIFSVKQSAVFLRDSIVVSSIVNLVCNGASAGSATVGAKYGATPYTYSWSDSRTTATATGLSAGTYTATVKDKNGCNATASVTITQPGILLATASTTANVSCHNGSNGSASLTASGGTSPYTYSWSGGGTASTKTGLSAGIYTITLKDHCGAIATASATITQPLALRDSIVTASTVNISCRGASTGSATAGVKYGTSPYTYLWNPGGQTNAKATALNAGTFSVTITDKNGCSVTASVSITQPLRALRDSVVSQTNELCNGQSTADVSIGVALGANPFTFLWSPTGKTNQIASGLSAGTYTVTITNYNGCSNTLAVTITQPAAIRDSIVTFSCPGAATVGVKGGTLPYTYKWSPGTGTSATMTSLSNGTYTITVKDKNGCAGITLTQSFNCSITQPRNEVDNQNPDCCPDKVTLYPNPNTGQFTLSGVEKGMIIEIYDYTGKCISSQFTTDNSPFIINISNHADGMYLLRIISKDGTLVSQKKVVKTE